MSTHPTPATRLARARRMEARYAIAAWAFFALCVITCFASGVNILVGAPLTSAVLFPVALAFFAGFAACAATNVRYLRLQYRLEAARWTR